MLNLDHENPRKLRRDPLLILLVRLFLLDVVVTREMESLRIVRLQFRIGRCGAEVINAADEVVVKDHQRETRLRMFVKTFRYQHHR